MVYYGAEVAEIYPATACKTTNVVIRRIDRRPAAPFIEISSSHEWSHRCISLTRVIAGRWGFFTLTQLFETPPRYERLVRFETKPSSPNMHA